MSRTTDLFNVYCNLQLLTLVSGTALLLHLVACMWIFTAVAVNPEFVGTWVEAFNLTTAGHQEVYVNSLYWTISTLGV